MEEIEFRFRTINKKLFMHSQSKTYIHHEQDHKIKAILYETSTLSRIVSPESNLKYSGHIQTYCQTCTDQYGYTPLDNFHPYGIIESGPMSDEEYANHFQAYINNEVATQ